MVRHFSPPLLLQARHHLGSETGSLHDAEDLVNEVWAIALPRLPKFKEKNGGLGPAAVLAYLSRILLHRCARLLSRQRAGHETQPLPHASDVPADVSGVVSHAVRREASSTVDRLLRKLDARDRAVLVLHGVERLSYERIAPRLGEDPVALRVRYRRAVALLRAWFPASVFEELSET